MEKNAEKLPEEIIKASGYISAMRKELNKNSRSGGQMPSFSISPSQISIPSQTTQAKNEDEIDKTISLYTFRTLQSMLRIAEYHLEAAKVAKDIKEMKDNCDTVGNIYLGFIVLTELFNPDGPINLRKITNFNNHEIDVSRFKFEGSIDCSNPPLNKMGKTVRLSNPKYPTKRIGVYISPERRWFKIPNLGTSKELPPRLNIQIPVRDHIISTEKNDNIITIRWDFDPVGIDTVKPTLDLVWLGQNENVSYRDVGVYLIAGHHITLDENLPLVEATAILERLNQYIIPTR